MKAFLIIHAGLYLIAAAFWAFIALFHPAQRAILPVAKPAQWGMAVGRAGFFLWAAYLLFR